MPFLTSTVSSSARTSSRPASRPSSARWTIRSEEHTSELQSHVNLVCRLLLEKNKEIKEVEPRLVVPSLFSVKGRKRKGAPLSDFMKEFSAKEQPHPKLTIIF